MKKSVIVFLAALLAGVASHALYLGYRSPSIAEHEAVFEDLRWLRAEFDLEREQFEAISALYEEYRPVCEELCHRVMATQERLNHLLADSNEVTPELRNALEAYSQVKLECHQAMLEHIYQVASEMAPDQRERYLERAKIHVTMHDPVR